MNRFAAHHAPAGSWLRPAISAGLFLLAGLLTAWDAAADQQGPVTVSENVGQVCIWRGRTGSGAEIMFLPDLGCLSSSCTLPLEQSFRAEVRDGDMPEIAMTSRFVVRSIDTGGPCTADCGGAGTASTVLTQLATGTYRLTLGGHEIGILDTRSLSGDPHNRTCFGRRDPR